MITRFHQTIAAHGGIDACMLFKNRLVAQGQVEAVQAERIPSAMEIIWFSSRELLSYRFIRELVDAAGIDFDVIGLNERKRATGIPRTPPTLVKRAYR